MISAFDTIADELAERGFAVADQFLSQTEVRTILSLDEFKTSADGFRRAGIGKQQHHQINETIRGD